MTCSLRPRMCICCSTSRHVPSSSQPQQSRTLLHPETSVTIELGALPPAAALKLFEQQLGRALAADERRAAEQIFQQAAGHALALMQAAAAARNRDNILQFDDDSEPSPAACQEASSGTAGAAPRSLAIVRSTRSNASRRDACTSPSSGRIREVPAGSPNAKTAPRHPRAVAERSAVSEHITP